MSDFKKMMEKPGSDSENSNEDDDEDEDEDKDTFDTEFDTSSLLNTHAASIVMKGAAIIKSLFDQIQLSIHFAVSLSSPAPQHHTTNKK